MIDASRSVRRMLELLTLEFPNYQNDNDELVAAVVAMSHVCGALGAITLMKGGEQRLDKMLKLVTRNIQHTAHEGAKVGDLTLKSKSN